MMIHRFATRCLLPACFGLVGIDAASAQIDLMNHRQWVWVMQERRVLLDLVKDFEPKRLDSIAVALTKTQESVPLLTLARARALAEGVEADAPYRFRAGLQVFALPEVASRPRFKELAVTVYAPHTGLTGALPMPQKFAFGVRVTDAKGKEVFCGRIEETDEIRDLREFRTTCKVPIEKLPEGWFRVHVSTILDGDGPRAQDPPLSVPFAILDGYGKRSAVFRLDQPAPELVDVMGKLGRLSQVLLSAAAEYAFRPWRGIPGVSPSHAVKDLLRAERFYELIPAGKPPLLGLTGFVPTAIPAGTGDVAFVALRLPKGGLPGRGSAEFQELARRPLVLVMDSIPAWDPEGRRPSHPRVALPDYLAESLRIVGFDAKEEFQLVVVESPGRMRNTLASLQGLLQNLPQVFPFDAKRIVLVGAGHGARSVADLALRQKDGVRGLVLVNTGGGLATPQLATLGDVPILAIPGHGHVGAESIRLLRVCAKDAGRRGSLTILDGQKWPWCLALPLAARHIEAFARKVTQ